MKSIQRFFMRPNIEKQTLWSDSRLTKLQLHLHQCEHHLCFQMLTMSKDFFTFKLWQIVILSESHTYNLFLVIFIQDEAAQRWPLVISHLSSFCCSSHTEVTSVNKTTLCALIVKGHHSSLSNMTL